MFHHKENTKDLTYFDVRLKTHGLKNTVLIRGNDAEIESVPLEGHVKILTKLDLHVKRVKLVLTGEQYVDYYSKGLDGLSAGQITERNCVVKVVWPNLLCSAKGEIHYGDYADLIVKYHKADLLAKRSADGSFADLQALANAKPKRPGFQKVASLPNVTKNSEASSLIKIPRSGIDGTPYPSSGAANSETHSFLLPNGNYSMPFYVILPANVPESVEGLSIGKIRYKLECLIERGRFERTFKKARHFRLIRTLGPQNVNLYDSIDFANTWPGKIDFNVSLAKKGLALGTTVPVKLVVVPLVKGLSFKSMYAEIVQHSYVTGIWGKSPAFEHVVGKMKLEITHSQISEDSWVITGNYHIPSSLNEITQTVTMKNDIISVKHRLRLQIHIRNADKHVSELRANLPIVLYLSPKHGHVTTKHLEVDASGYFTSDPDPERQDVVFPKREEAETPSAEEPSEAVELAEDEDDQAPPVYTLHMKDILYDYQSQRTPMEQLRALGDPGKADGYFSLHITPKSGSVSPRVDLLALLKIPCYEEALEEDSDENVDEPSPRYVGDSSSNSRESTPASKILIPRPQLSERSSSMSNLVLKDRASPARRKIHFMRKEKH